MPVDAAGPVVTAALPGVAVFAVYFALAVIAAIGLDMILRKQGRRASEGGDRRERDAVPAGVDPVSLRRRRPLTQKLSGAVLIAAVIVLLLALRPILGLA